MIAKTEGVQMKRRLYFVSKNMDKYKEMQAIMDPDVLDLECQPTPIAELQVESMEILVKKKALEAYKELRRPVVVEHTALWVSALNELPGLGTEYFYTRLGNEKIVKCCRKFRQYDAAVKSYICICDGEKFIIGRGKEEGRITRGLKNGKGGFAWDTIFIPNENNPKHLTYAEMTQEEKNSRSMRKKAWENLKKENPVWWDDFIKITDAEEEKNLEMLARLIKEKKVMLFIGAGISASVGFASWGELISRLGIDQGYDKEIFKEYGNNMMLAEYVDNRSRRVYEKIREIFRIDDDIRAELKKSEIYDALLKLDCPVIYTTNYDHLIEEYYRMEGHKFNRVVTIEDMQQLDPENSTRIMKFHGDIEKEASIVLTESQYYKRMDFQNFMDVQLQADMLQYHVLFLGYSLSDINMKLLLYLSGKRQENSANKMKGYIFTATPNKVQKEVFRKNGIISFSGGTADKKEATKDFLIRLCEMVKQVS